MKRIAMALIVCMLLALVPAQASAAQFLPLPEPIPAPTALAEVPQTLSQLPAEPQEGFFKITMTSSGPGRAELYSTSANALDRV